LLVASLVLAGCHGSTDKAGGAPAATPTVLTLADPLDDPTQLDGFVAEVSRLSGGSLRIVARPDPRAGQVSEATGTIRDVRAGKADLGVAGVGVWDSVGVRGLRALGAPLLIDSYVLQDRVVRSPLIRGMLKGLQPLGLVGLGVLPGPLRRPLGFARPLLGPADYRGLRVGVQHSQVASATMRALGATPVPFAVGGSPKGLGGLEANLNGVLGGGYDRNGGYLTRNVVLWPRPSVVFANRRNFARLTPDQQRILEQALADSIAPETRFQRSYEAISLQLLCDRRRLRRFHFVTADGSDLATLRRSVRPVYAALEYDPQTRHFIAEIAAMRTRLGRRVDGVPSCRAAVPAGGVVAPSPADGAYALTVAPGELPSSQRIAEEYGSWQLVLDRGQFRLTQQSDQADWDADGLVHVTGNQMVWTVRHAPDWGPHGAPDGVPVEQTETLRFRWRRSGAALVLVSEDTKAKLPALSVRPLARVADAPGQQPLDNPEVLQGTWAMNATVADAVAHHQSPGGIPDNSGPLRLTLHGNRCRWEERAPDGYHWGVGTCKFAGDTLEFDQTQTDNEGDPGPYFLHWSVFHGRLTFRVAPGVSPGTWTYHPWRKVSG
jgi:TRAP-type transport system periplasmic protein